ncbi:MAG: alpha/beta fold hydrolase [Anaerolineae bacterium]|nr:alpha/beta fold hydrolase [Anaerolineae bacterium]MBT7073089.1 alpha/beta fold hydrolase [Anaerolineae bacterium]MBT7602471.1 alpha/beta fold hydrolase [Anaerolineae bacterium]MBT7990688.1 alpha/beta fold hydrolase [Anaerolineae bacterium]
MKRVVFFLVAILSLLSACSFNGSTPTPSATATTSYTPSPSITPSPTATSTATPIPTATPNPHPLSIERMRADSYPGSEIVIEEELTPGSNYSRYYASYQSEGLTIYGLLTVPNGEKPATGWPVIVFNHGYIPPDVYKTTERYVAYVDMLARNGYIVFRTDYRGHDRSEGEARGPYGNPDYTIDVLNAVAAIKQFPDANPERIGMWGHSMGGYITLRSMVVSPDIKAGVIWAGVVVSYPDLLTKWRRGDGASPIPTPRPGSWRLTIFDTYGSFEENPEFWSAISSNSYVADISGPIQLHHGSADKDVPLEFSEILFYELLEAEQFVELYKYEGDNHNISNNFNLAMERTIEFFDRYLK